MQQQIRRLIGSNRRRAEVAGHRLPPASTDWGPCRLEASKQTEAPRHNQYRAVEAKDPSLGPTNLDPRARIFLSTRSVAPVAVESVRGRDPPNPPASESSWWDRFPTNKTSLAPSSSSLKPIDSSSGIILPPVTQAGEIRSLFTFVVPFRPFPDCRLPVGPATRGVEKQRSANKHWIAHSAPSTTRTLDGDQPRLSDLLSATQPSENLEERLQSVLQKYGAGPVAGQANSARSRSAKRKARRKAVRFSESSSDGLGSSICSLSASRSSGFSASSSVATPPGPAISPGRDLLHSRHDLDLLGSSEEEGELILIGKLVDVEAPLDEDIHAGRGHTLSANFDQPVTSANQDFPPVQQLSNAVQRKPGSHPGALAGRRAGSRAGFRDRTFYQQPGGSRRQCISAQLGQGFVSTAAEAPSGKARTEVGEPLPPITTKAMY